VLSSTKSLLTVTAVVEVGTGLLLLVAPSLTAETLFGAGLVSPGSRLMGRIGGAALLAIGLSCWLERNREGSARAIGLVAGLVVYNAAVVMLIVHGALVDGVRGLGSWPAVGLHSMLLVWCSARLRAA
jgi:hypothetical protein